MIQALAGIQATAAALTAESTRLNVISENIANVNNTHGLEGKPYQRQVVVFESAMQQAMGGQPGAAAPALQVARIQKDPRPGESVYAPGNVDADARGMVRMPNVNMQEEMADMINASRAFEANLAVVKNARQIFTQTLAMGKH